MSRDSLTFLVLEFGHTAAKLTLVPAFYRANDAVNDKVAAIAPPVRVKLDLAAFKESLPQLAGAMLGLLQTHCQQLNAPPLRILLVPGSLSPELAESCLKHLKAQVLSEKVQHWHLLTREHALFAAQQCGLTLNYDPQQLGLDRLLNALGVLASIRDYPGPLSGYGKAYFPNSRRYAVMIDAGTAIKMDALFVKPEGGVDFIAGAILPGLAQMGTAWQFKPVSASLNRLRNLTAALWPSLFTECFHEKDPEHHLMNRVSGNFLDYFSFDNSMPVCDTQASLSLGMRSMWQGTIRAAFTNLFNQVIKRHEAVLLNEQSKANLDFMAQDFKTSERMPEVWLTGGDAPAVEVALTAEAFDSSRKSIKAPALTSVGAVVALQLADSGD
ncbi:MAG: type III pantothenate kinase [Vampirovibrionales bacterium]|nr:type III pantothenate kinase [Vampirovibrionales bacterium]